MGRRNKTENRSVNVVHSQSGHVECLLGVMEKAVHLVCSLFSCVNVKLFLVVAFVYLSHAQH